MARPKGTEKNGWKYLDESQLKSFIKALKDKGNLRDQAMMELTLYLGLRVSELVSIKLSDIDQESQAITVQGIKGGRKRTYGDIEQKLWKRLTLYIHQSKVENRLFPITAQAAKNVFKKYAGLAGFSADYSIHCLRHSCAMLRVKSPDPYVSSPVAIMKWLRHKDIGSAQRYFEQAVFEQESQRVNQVFGQFL